LGGLAVRLFTLLELLAQVAGLVGATQMALRLGIGVSVGELLALGQLLVSLAFGELRGVGIVWRLIGGHDLTISVAFFGTRNLASI
jgi:hypothetical protein